MINIRRGNINDIDTLVELRLEFLYELGTIKDEEEKINMEVMTYDYFRSKIDNGFLFWVALDDNKIIGISGLIFIERPPISIDLSGREGYILNMYTIPEYRGKSIATAMIKEIIAYLKKLNIKKVRLNATEAGRSIYAKLGFKSEDSEMEMTL
jgi:GNAT superfamily N-acetyltransferase